MDKKKGGVRVTFTLKTTEVLVEKIYLNVEKQLKHIMKLENNIIDKILSEIDEYQLKQFELDYERDIAWGEFLIEKGHKYNTPTSYSIKLLKENGHKPLAICSYYGEETFFFKTMKEAKRAYNDMELEKRLICGWFHSVEEINKLKHPDGSKVEVEWIKD